MSFLRNPLTWHKRYVEGVYDMPSGPAAIIGRAGHKALEYYYCQAREGYDRNSVHNQTKSGRKPSEDYLLRKAYQGASKEVAIEQGLGYLQSVSDFEIEFGKAHSVSAKKAKRKAMEKEYLQAVGFYLERPPRHKVLGVEVMSTARVKGLPLPIKAVSDLVVESRVEKGAIDIVDHKFVDSFSAIGNEKPLFVLQAIFNYFTVQEVYGLPVKRFILQECKKKKNRNGASQMKRHVILYEDHKDDFELFFRLINDASTEIARRQVFLPNPSDMFEGKNSFEIYRMGLVGDE